MFAGVGERVVVEEELLDLRKTIVRPFDFGDDVFHGTGSIFVAGDCLRPETERAPRFATPARIERHVGVQHIAVVIIERDEVALIDLGDPGQTVHVLDQRPFSGKIRFAILDDGDADDAFQRRALGDLLDGEVEFAVAHEIDRRRRQYRRLVIDRHMGSAEPDQQVRIRRLVGFRHLDVVDERRCAGIDDEKFVLTRRPQQVIQVEPARRRVD